MRNFLLAMVASAVSVGAYQPVSRRGWLGKVAAASGVAAAAAPAIVQAKELTLVPATTLYGEPASRPEHNGRCCRHRNRPRLQHRHSIAKSIRHQPTIQPR